MLRLGLMGPEPIVAGVPGCAVFEEFWRFFLKNIVPNVGTQAAAIPPVISAVSWIEVSRAQRGRGESFGHVEMVMSRLRFETAVL